MTEFVGTVEKVTERDWKNGITMYHFTLAGSPIIHSCGTKNPEVTEGQNIRFKEYNRKVDTSTIETVSAEEVKSESPKANGSAPAMAYTSEVDVGSRIRWQEARRDAVRLVTTAMETDLLPYPKSGKNQDKWDRMLDLIEETTNDLITQEDQKWTKRSES